MKALLARVAVAALIAGDVGIGAAGPASAAACTASPIQAWKAYNVNCSYVRHYDRLTDGTYKWAATAYPGHWSSQGVCWANVASYGVSKGSKVNWT